MDKIDDLITSTIVSTQPSARTKCVLHSSIRKALGLAKKTMNKYYSATDMSNIYCITMGVFLLNSVSAFLTCIFLVLHPSLKLEYFRSRNWADSWITTAKELVSEEYEMYLAVGGGVDDVVEVDGDMVRGKPSFVFTCL
jgi:hypothetical protein